VSELLIAVTLGGASPCSIGNQGHVIVALDGRLATAAAAHKVPN